MKIKTTRFKNLKVFQGKSHLDNRGAFRELFSKNSIKEFNGVFWCMSKSKKNVLRGLHLQTKNSQEKFVSVIRIAMEKFCFFACYGLVRPAVPLSVYFCRN